MPNHGSDMPFGAESAMTRRWMTILFSALLASTAGAAGNNTDGVRDLAGRVGPIVGSALACPDIARPRIRVIVDKFAAVIEQASSNEAESDDLTQLFDRSVADGRNAATTGKIDCSLADRQLADLERSIAAWAVGRRRRYLGPICQRALPGQNSPVGSPTAFRFGRSRKADILKCW